MRFRLVFLPLLFGTAPQLAEAASIAGSRCASVVSNFQCFAQGIGNILMVGTAALVGIALILYFWGVVRKMWSAEAGNAKSITSLQTQLAWGFLAIFVILTIWGLLSLLGSLLFGTNNFNSLF